MQDILCGAVPERQAPVLRAARAQSRKMRDFSFKINTLPPPPPRFLGRSRTNPPFARSSAVPYAAPSGVRHFAERSPGKRHPTLLTAAAQVFLSITIAVLLGACSTFQRYDAELDERITLTRSSQNMKDKPDMFQVAKDYFVEWDHNLYMVPEGSETDFASIPERVRNLFAMQQAFDLPILSSGKEISITEVIGKWTEPSVVHDAAYRSTLKLMLPSLNRRVHASRRPNEIQSTIRHRRGSTCKNRA